LHGKLPNLEYYDGDGIVLLYGNPFSQPQIDELKAALPNTVVCVSEWGQHICGECDCRCCKCDGYCYGFPIVTPPVCDNYIPAEPPTVEVDFTLGHVRGNITIGIEDALTILRWLVGLPSVIEEGNSAWHSARITGGNEPTINDALQILRWLVGLDNLIDNPCFLCGCANGCGAELLVS
jgi:hypothetical protein